MMKNLDLNPDDKAKLKDYVISFSACLFSFIVFFYGNEYIAGKKGSAFVFAFNWEKNIPFSKYFFFVYYGIFLLPLLVPVLIKKKSDLLVLTKQIILAQFIAGLLFFFFPTKSLYQAQETNNFFWSLTYTLTGKYNLFPSLHVSLTLLFLKPLKYYSTNNIKILFTILAILLLLSTVFTHQHHIADVIGGIILYEVVTRIFPYEFQHHLYKLPKSSEGS
jgi:membrane-associated phospholipid phosphatase